MAAGTASGGSARSDTYASARYWLLLPAWAVLLIFVLAPVLVMLVYSFLTKEFRGGVIWDFTLAAYDQFFFDRGLFGDEPPTIEWTYIVNLLAVDLAGGRGNAAKPRHRVPDGLFHRHPAREYPSGLGVSDHDPLLGEPADPDRVDEVRAA